MLGWVWPLSAACAAVHRRRRVLLPALGGWGVPPPAGGGRGHPSGPLAPRHLAPCGLRASPLPARGGGWPPPAPSIPCGSGRGIVAAGRRLRRLRSARLRRLPAASRSAGHPCPPQGQAPAGRTPCGLAPVTARARLRRRCSGAARPPLCGGCGAVRASGPPACGGRRSRRQPLAASGVRAGAVGRRCRAGPAGRQSVRRALGGCALPGLTACVALARGWGAGYAACGRESQTGYPPSRMQQAAGPSLTADLRPGKC